MPKSTYMGETITNGYKCHIRGAIIKFITHTHTYTNRKVAFLL